MRTPIRRIPMNRIDHSLRRASHAEERIRQMMMPFNDMKGTTHGHT